ncbi:PREDICTED: ATP-dependent DNA helicase PIF1-like [Camelina sativa]|uniref:ATP-dependent DNA helicase n=1 Tax=Camelina sativa TaxID=90675 RepID=A0ABM0X569_CAMSA|nr:PREDICTED: ATP-dependent DNA helicase PIF1-like [Camelina sativa]
MRYNRDELQEKHDEWIQMLTDEQKGVYDKITGDVFNNLGGPNSDLANLVKKASLIIWDEAPMMSKYCFESLDRSFSDIIGDVENKVFAGKVVVFGGDFRQVLPVINGAGRAEIVLSALNSSYLWDHSEVLKLTKNMRLLKKNLSVEEAKEIQDFSDWLLDVGDGEEMVYLSADSIDPTNLDSLKNPVITSDFLNSIKLSGLPHHSLCLKVGAPVMLLRNIDPKGGLCNGTRLQITQMAAHVVEARVITGDRIGDIVLIPQIVLTPSDTKLPFKMRQRQFPLSVAFPMTINKSQGQSLEHVGLYLPRPVFSHGQLYVALSRVTSKKGLKILIVNKEGKIERKFFRIYR